jgi:hypothetical protein
MTLTRHRGWPQFTPLLCAAIIAAAAALAAGVAADDKESLKPSAAERPVLSATRIEHPCARDTTSAAR